MNKYYTVLGEGETSLIIEKSKFIGYAREIHSREDADKFFNEIRQKHKDASHNVPAFIIGDKMELKWASDDGEPQGTSGLPIMKLLENEGLTNVAVIVTRYFGGTLLGTGGLVRAYTSVAKQTLIAAGYAEVYEGVSVRCEVAYSHYDKLKSALPETEYSVTDIEYLEKITLTISTKIEQEQTLINLLSDVTGGNARIISIEHNDVKKAKP